MQNSTVETIYNARKCPRTLLRRPPPKPPPDDLRPSGGRCAADCLDPTSPHQQFLDPPLDGAVFRHTPEWPILATPTVTGNPYHVQHYFVKYLAANIAANKGG